MLQVPSIEYYLLIDHDKSCLWGLLFDLFLGRFWQENRLENMGAKVSTVERPCGLSFISKLWFQNLQVWTPLLLIQGMAHPKPHWGESLVMKLLLISVNKGFIGRSSVSELKVHDYIMYLFKGHDIVMYSNPPIYRASRGKQKCTVNHVLL